MKIIRRQHLSDRRLGRAPIYLAVAGCVSPNPSLSMCGMCIIVSFPRSLVTLPHECSLMEMYLVVHYVYL